MIVCCAERVAERGQQPACRLEIHRAFGEPLGEGPAFDKLGHEKDETRFVDPEIEEANDRRMVEGLEHRALPPKAPAHRFVCEVFGSEYFDRYLAALLIIRCPIHVPHGAASDLGHQLIAACQHGPNPNRLLLAHVAPTIPLFRKVAQTDVGSTRTMTTPDFDEGLEKLYGTPLPAVVVKRLKGDASTRSYFRVHAKEAGTGPSTIIVMQLPDDAFESDEGGAQPKITRLPFLEVGELLRARGIPVPKVYVEHLERGQVLLEDLGDTTLERRLLETPRARWKEPYGQAVDLLAEIHERCNDLPPGSIVARRKFDRALLEWELDHFRRWGLEELFGKLDPASARVVSETFPAIVAEIESMPMGFVHRDYQSRNLMVRQGGELTILDFQDALIGPRTYDLVALLCDSYVSLDIDLQEKMIARYAGARRIDADRVRREFWVVTLHRKLKDAGRFVFIDRKRNDAGFLQWYPQSLAYVGRALTQLGRFGPLDDLLRSEIPGFPGSIARPTSMIE